MRERLWIIHLALCRLGWHHWCGPWEEKVGWVCGQCGKSSLTFPGDGRWLMLGRWVHRVFSKMGFEKPVASWCKRSWWQI